MLAALGVAAGRAAGCGALGFDDLEAFAQFRVFLGERIEPLKLLLDSLIAAVKVRFDLAHHVIAGASILRADAGITPAVGAFHSQVAGHRHGLISTCLPSRAPRP